MEVNTSVKKRRPPKPKVPTLPKEIDESKAAAPKKSTVKHKRKPKPKSKPQSNEPPPIFTVESKENLTEVAPLIADVPKSEMKKAEPPLTSKDAVQAEREARRQAKLVAKHKQHDETRKLSPPQTAESVPVEPTDDKPETKSREQIMAEREQKKQAKLLKKKGITIDEQPVVAAEMAAAVSLSIVKEGIENLKFSASEIPSAAKIQPSKAERRAIQEAQRAAKAKLLAEKSAGKPLQSKSTAAKSEPQTDGSTVAAAAAKSPTTGKKQTNITTIKLPAHRVKLFSHLYADAGSEPEHLLNSNDIHPALVKLGAQYASRMVVGSNARCLAFMAAMKKVIQDFRTPAQKEFSRGLEENIQPGLAYLHQCRALAVSVSNAVKFIKWQITQLPANETDTQLRERLLDAIDTYIRDQIEKAAQAISISVQEKISNGDVILTFGCSSLINHILEEAQSRKVNFRVVIVDARPDNEGRQQLERLVAAGIKCSFVLINAIGFIMPEVTKVLLGAHALLANGYVTARAGTAQVALVAKTYNVPVLVCCETHKFSERVQTDAFVYNELGNPSDVIRNSGKQTVPLANWTTLPHLTPLNLKYDITPPELVTAVVTELAIMPCTSVPVILRIKPSEIGY